MYSTIAKLRKRLEQVTSSNITKEEEVFKQLSVYRQKVETRFVSIYDNFKFRAKNYTTFSLLLKTCLIYASITLLMLKDRGSVLLIVLALVIAV